MFVAAVIVSALLALATAFSGYGKLTGNPQVVEPLTTKLGVPRRFIPVLGALLLAGAVGTVAGIWWAPIGIAATAASSSTSWAPSSRTSGRRTGRALSRPACSWCSRRRP